MIDSFGPLTSRECNINVKCNQNFIRTLPLHGGPSLVPIYIGSFPRTGLNDPPMLMRSTLEQYQQMRVCVLFSDKWKCVRVGPVPGVPYIRMEVKNLSQSYFHIIGNMG